MLIIVLVFSWSHFLVSCLQKESTVRTAVRTAYGGSPGVVGTSYELQTVVPAIGTAQPRRPVYVGVGGGTSGTRSQGQNETKGNSPDRRTRVLQDRRPGKGVPASDKSDDEYWSLGESATSSTESEDEQPFNTGLAWRNLPVAPDHPGFVKTHPLQPPDAAAQNRLCSFQSSAAFKHEREARKAKLNAYLLYDDTKKSRRNRLNADVPDNFLQFDSRFECGNLGQALTWDGDTYFCTLRKDIHTKGNIQWFYFKIFNPNPEREYTFRLTNMQKPDSLYNYGLRPLLWSKKIFELSGEGWDRVGTEVCYYRNQTHTGSKSKKKRYTLHFKVKLPGGENFLAHCFPYSYTRLQNVLTELVSRPHQDVTVERRLLCRTVAGNRCELIRICSEAGSKDRVDKPVVVISGRIHPGETNSSFMVEGLLRFLLDSDEVRASLLRNAFEWIIVPMLNPDGVVLGNYRTGLAGVDLNRTWKVPNAGLHPTVHSLKKLLVGLYKSRRNVIAFVDFHGHSRKKGVFTYGCSAKYASRSQLDSGLPVPPVLDLQSQDGSQIPQFPKDDSKPLLKAFRGFEERVLPALIERVELEELERQEDNTDFYGHGFDERSDSIDACPAFHLGASSFRVGTWVALLPLLRQLTFSRIRQGGNWSCCSVEGVWNSFKLYFRGKLNSYCRL